MSIITWTTASSVAYKDYTDEVSNFMRMGSDTTLWLTQLSDASSVMKTEIPAAELAIAGDQIKEIALSGNVAVIFYGNTIKYLQHKNDNDVKLIFAKTITSANIDLTQSEYQYNIVFSCTCHMIKRFACFSSTLNCLIVKKGS